MSHATKVFLIEGTAHAKVTMWERTFGFKSRKGGLCGKNTVREKEKDGVRQGTKAQRR